MENTGHRSGAGWISGLLAMVAGFCDTATFLRGRSIFSAHVTGNFVVFAAQLATVNRDGAAWTRLLTFPVFFAAVMAGGWIVDRARHKRSILLVEGIVLIGAGLVAVSIPVFPAANREVVVFGVVLTTVAGMGLQNAYGKLFAKETLGPTTMMTGNVTQAALSLGALIRKGKNAGEAVWADLRGQRIIIGAFFGGCLVGGVLAMWLGLGVIVLPGLAIATCYWWVRSRKI